MDRTQLLQHFDTLAETPEAVTKLRKLVLELAVQGRIKTQAGEGGSSQVRLDNLGDWALGCGFPTAEQGHADRPILFSKVSDMNLAGNEREILKTNHTIDEATANRLRIKAHPPGTVIFPKIGGAIATNKRRIIVKPTAIDNNCLGIIPNKSCSTEWLFVVLSAIDFTAYQSGTSVPALNQGTIGEIEVSLPPLAEQRRIVAKVEELLALCDELEARQTAAREHRTRLVRSALDHLTTAKDKADFRKHSTFVLQHSAFVLEDVPALRQAILSLAVQGKLVPQVSSDESATVLLEKVRKARRQLAEKGKVKTKVQISDVEVAAEPYPIPDTWLWVPLNELTELVYGKLLPTSELLPTGFPVFGANGIIGSYSKYHYEHEMLLISCRGAYSGKPNISPPKCYVTNNSIVCEFFDSKACDIRFFQAVIAISPRERIVTGTAQPQVTVANAIKLPVPLPPLAEQQRIVAKVDELLRWCDALEARLTAARTTATHLLDATLHQILRPAA